MDDDRVQVNNIDDNPVQVNNMDDDPIQVNNMDDDPIQVNNMDDGTVNKAGEESIYIRNMIATNYAEKVNETGHSERVIPDVHINTSGSHDRVDKVNVDVIPIVYTNSLRVISEVHRDKTQHSASQEIIDEKTPDNIPDVDKKPLRSHQLTDKNCSAEPDTLRCLRSPNIIIQPKLICTVPHTYVIYVLSKIGANNEYNSSTRDLIRNTWANYNKLKPYLPSSITLKIMFVIGRPTRYTRNDKMVSM
jgi:hypothetical protein